MDAPALRNWNLGWNQRQAIRGWRACSNYRHKRFLPGWLLPDYILSFGSPAHIYLTGAIDEARFVQRYPLDRLDHNEVQQSELTLHVPRKLTHHWHINSPHEKPSRAGKTGGTACPTTTRRNLLTRLVGQAFGLSSFCVRDESRFESGGDRY
jgi:hypothetical protein